MFYLIGQIVLCLLFTALIGVAAGWLLRGIGSSRHNDVVAAEWRAKVERLESRQETATAGVAATAPPDTRIDALQKRLAESERELATLRTARAVRTQTDNGATQEQLRETRLVCQQLQGRVAEQQTLHEQLKTRLQMARTERETLVERLRDLESRYAQLNQERQHAIDTIAGLQKDLRARQAEAGRQPASEPPPRVQPAQSADEGAARAARALEAATKSDARAGDDGAGQQSLPIADTGKTPTEPKPYEPAWRLRAPDGAPDNLQAVYGIGPKIEQRLNELGIFHFRQLAAFEKPDILWVARHLQSFPGRILRDRWVEQARSLEKRRRAGQPI